MNVNAHADGSRSRPPAAALYVIAGMSVMTLATVALLLRRAGFGQGLAVPLIPAAWLLLSPLARLARRRGGDA